jgi:hypothetical protein
LPGAKPGDVCVLLQPAVGELAHVRRTQQKLQRSFGGRPQVRVHFTCQRFDVVDSSQLTAAVETLRAYLAEVQPFPVMAGNLERVEHPFFEFGVLRWDLHRTAAMWRFAHKVEAALRSVGARVHYPTDAGWHPHVTALEAVRAPQNGPRRVSSSGANYLFSGQRVVLSQVAPEKRFRIIGTIPLAVESAVREPAWTWEGH